jgi:GTP-binding protein Era
MTSLSFNEERSGGEPRSAMAARDAASQTEASAPQLAGDAAAFRAGFVAILGRPNVGKSTLLNQLLGEKLAIVSPKPQTTRNRLLGIKNAENAQLALVDTPGIHRVSGQGRTLLNRFMVEEALTALADVDVVVLVTDLKRAPDLTKKRRAEREAKAEKEAALATAIEKGQVPPSSAAAPVAEDPLREAAETVAELMDPGDRFVVQQLQRSGKPMVLAINKIDLLKEKHLMLPLIQQWEKTAEFRAIVPICAQDGRNVDALLAELCAAVPAGEPLFPEEMLTDRSERFLVEELVREQIFLTTRQELPYSVAVTLDAWEERIADHGKRAGERIGVVITATIHVEKHSHKKIIVGEHGQMIRDIGTAARIGIGELLGCNAHLSLFVRVDEDWTATPGGLRKMGYEAHLDQILKPKTTNRSGSRKGSPRPASKPSAAPRSAHAESHKGQQ